MPRGNVVQQQEEWTSRGAYTPDQAARLLRIEPRMVVRWLYGNRHAAALIPEIPFHQGELITFLDLVQAMAVRRIRIAKKISLQKIRAAVDCAREKGVLFPFARQHVAYVFRGEVVLRLNDGTIIEVTGKYKNQQLSEPIVYEYMDDLGFDDHGLANIYRPLKAGFREVRLSPHLNWGAPTIFPSRYTVATLVDAYNAEGGYRGAANICNVNEQDVRLAVQYEKSLARCA